jgi:hypothetical protein
MKFNIHSFFWLKILSVIIYVTKISIKVDIQMNTIINQEDIEHIA